MEVNIGCKEHTHTCCYKAFMKREGILTDWHFFSLMKRKKTINSNAGVFSLSKTSWHKVKFLKFSSFFLSTHGFEWGNCQFMLSFVLLTVDVKNLCCCIIYNISSLITCVAFTKKYKHLLVSQAALLSCVQLSMAMTRWLCFVKWQIHQVLQSHNPNCTISQKGVTGFASATNDSRSSPRLSEREKKKWDNKNYRWSLLLPLITKFVVHLRCQSRPLRMLKPTL